jgi:hypothetical protein
MRTIVSRVRALAATARPNAAVVAGGLKGW